MEDTKAREEESFLTLPRGGGGGGGHGDTTHDCFILQYFAEVNILS